MPIRAMFAYNQSSEGGKELARSIDIPRIKHAGSNFRAKREHTLLNWGATSDRWPEALRNAGRILNNPAAVDIAVDKTLTFRTFRQNGVSCPDFTTDRQEARQWLEAGEMVFARTLTRASSGRGIQIMDPDHQDTWDVQAPLYVKYMKKKHEFRVHVMNGRVIDTQRKGLRREFEGREGVNHKIRNLANGFVFVRNDGFQVPQCVLDTGTSAVRALGLDFGAADVIYNERQQQAYAIEVNTAPGLQGETVENYRNAILAEYR